MIAVFASYQLALTLELSLAGSLSLHPYLFAAVNSYLILRYAGRGSIIFMRRRRFKAHRPWDLIGILLK